MSLKDFNSGIRELDRGIKTMQKAHKLELIRIERNKRHANLRRAAQQMEARGASKSSMRGVLTAFNEYFILLNKPTKPDTSTPLPVPNSDPPGFLLSDVETHAITWLWEKRIPLGKITVLDGDPGMGKSLIAAHIAACVTTGRPMPDGTPTRQGGVILIAPEDSPEDTLKPRLEAAGGDPSRVLLLNTAEDLDLKKLEIYDRPFSLAHDLTLLENAINRMNAVLVIIDPLMAALGSTIDSSRDQSIREVFTPLAQLAERTGCAILLIRHLSRRTSGHPLHRGAGSTGIIAAARSGLIVTPDPVNEQRRVLASTKHNLSQAVSNLTYQIVNNDHGAPSIHWLAENHHPVQALLSPSSLSYERRAVLKALEESPTPLHSAQVASATGLKHDNVRRMLPRLADVGEIASPSRGLYTSIQHTPLPPPTNLNHNNAVPPETIVPSVANVPTDPPIQNQDAPVPNDESAQEVNNPVPTETTVPIVANVPNDLPTQESITLSNDHRTDERTQEENNAIPPEAPIPIVANDPPTQQENSTTPTESIHETAVATLSGDK